MKPLVFGLACPQQRVEAIAHAIGGECGALVLHRFPDGETYVRLDTPVAQRDVVFVCALHRPDYKLLPLLFALDAARDLGARSAGLVAPYLAYMRQDARFKPGESITSVTFARVVSAAADWNVTVDPHLHIHSATPEIYTIPDRVVPAAPQIAAWIAANVSAPLVVGPDSESEQWVARVADAAGAPYVVFDKRRDGDREVTVRIPQLDRFAGRVPVIVDDIVSTAGTMIAAAAQLRQAGLPAPVCVGVHALFADDAYEALCRAGAACVVTCNTVAHPSNAIDLDQALGLHVRALLDDCAAEERQERR
jgi:ribose-phosphate pyrophosphokinase